MLRRTFPEKWTSHGVECQFTIRLSFSLVLDCHLRWESGSQLFYIDCTRCIDLLSSFIFWSLFCSYFPVQLI
jgi:hypothetical protein